MNDMWNRRNERRDLAERLMVEYAGSVPPGQILAAVTRAHRLVKANHLGGSNGGMALCEAVARRSIADRIISATPRLTDHRGVLA
ncbi:MAG: hypothetical protein NTX33_05280 [Propionibacteriales bacterium]|nr:hypothetical protein [Propionibacteriales bacterium]